MFEIEVVEKKGQTLVDSRLLHKALEVKSYHSDWIKRRVNNYGFEAGQDFFLLLKNERQKGRGGHNLKTYFLTLDMAKELSMIENNDKGRLARRYFITVEKQFFAHKEIRSLSKHTRKTLTDSVRDSGENERMHGHGYSTYTALVYEICGLKFEYKQFKSDKKIITGYEKLKFRDLLSEPQLKNVELVESLIKPFLEMDKKYAEIKDIIFPIFKSYTIKKELS